MVNGGNGEAKAVKAPNLAEVNRLVRAWSLTINAHEQEPVGCGIPTVAPSQIEEAFQELDSGADFVFQLERGKNNGPQGYLHFQASLLLSRSHPRRRKDVARVLKAHGIEDAHIEATRRVGAADSYCSKADTRVAGPFWSSFEFEESARRKALAHGGGGTPDRSVLKEAIESGMTPSEIMLDDRLSLMMAGANQAYADRYFTEYHAQRWSHEVRDVKAIYLWGDTGVGKSTSVRDWSARHHLDLFSAHLGGRDPFGMYKFEPVLLLDEFRESVPIEEALQLLDRFPYELDRRYSDSWAAWTTVFVVSNWPLERQYAGADTPSRAAFQRRFSKAIHMTKGMDDVEY